MDSMLLRQALPCLMVNIIVLLAPHVTTTISNSEFITAGRLETAEYWFMTTDKAAADISYSSASGSVEVLLLGSWGIQVIFTTVPIHQQEVGLS